MTDLARFQIQITTEESKRNVDALTESLDNQAQAARANDRGISDLQDRLAALRTRADELIETQQSLGTRTAATGAATAATSVNMAGLGRTLTTAAGSALGLDSRLTGVLRTVGSMAAGGGLMVGASLAVAGLAAAYRKATEESRQKREEADKMIASLEREREAAKLTAAAYVGVAGERVAALEERVRKAREELAEFQDPAAFAGNSERAYAAQIRSQRRILALTSELRDAEDNLATARQRAAREVVAAQSDEIATLVALIGLGKQRAEDTARLAVLEKALTDEIQAGAEAELLRAHVMSAERRLEIERLLGAIRGAGAKSDEARATALRALADAELKAAQGLAMVRKDYAASERLRIEETMRAIDRQVAAAKNLNTAERERLRTAALITAAVERQLELTERLARVGERAFGTHALKRFEGGIEQTRGTSRVPMGDTSGFDPNALLAQMRANRAALDDMITGLGALGAVTESHRQSLYDQIDATEQARYAAVNLVGALGVVPGSILNMADAIIRLDADLKARAVGQLGNAEFKGGLTGGDVLSLASAGIGIIGQILQSRRQAELEAARLKAAQADFDRTLARFADSIGPQSPLQRELAALADQFVALANQAAAARNILLTGDPSTYDAENIAARRLAIEKEIADLSATEMARRLGGLLAERAFLADLERILKVQAEAEKAARERLEAERALAQRRVQDDIQVESLRLGGDSGAADRLALQQEQAQRFTDALAQGFNQATLDMLNGLFDLQRAALEFREQTEAIQRAHDRDILGLTTTGRELRLAGRDTDADQLALQIEAIQKLAEADKLRREGLIDEELHARLTALAHGELAQAMAALQKAAEDAAAATAAAVARQREDLEVRLLAARGQTDEADALQRRLRYQRELAETTDTGLQALITLIFQTEEQARVTERAAEAARGLQAALAAQARFMEDLRERELRATGRGEAADEFARLRRDAEEVRRALGEGFSADAVAELQRVQALERAQADEERRRRQDEAFQRAQGGSVAEVPLSASPTTVSLAVGVTESTGTRLAGLMSSQLAYQAYLPRMDEKLARIASAVERGHSGPSAGALEIALAQSAADAAADAGLIPGSQN